MKFCLSGWELRHWVYLLRDPAAYFAWLYGQVDSWPSSYEPDLADGSSGDTVMHSWVIAEWGDWTAMLHRFSTTDEREPYHSHQASWGFRFILWGSYVEEVIQADGALRLVEWKAGMFGIVRHSLEHRMRSIGEGGCISLWVRGPTRNAVTWRFPCGTRRVLSLDEMDL